MIKIDKIKNINNKYAAMLVLFLIYSVMFIYELIYSSFEEQLSKGIGWVIFLLALFLFKNKFNDGKT